jgi:hypothetical protein
MVRRNSANVRLGGDPTIDAAHQLSDSSSGVSFNQSVAVGQVEDPSQDRK